MSTVEFDIANAIIAFGKDWFTHIQQLDLTDVVFITLMSFAAIMVGRAWRAWTRRPVVDASEHPWAKIIRTAPRDEEPTVNPFAIETWNMTEQALLWQRSPGLAYKMATYANADDGCTGFRAQPDSPLLMRNVEYRDGPAAQKQADLTNIWAAQRRQARAAAEQRKARPADFILTLATGGLLSPDRAPDADVGRVEIIERDEGSTLGIDAEGHTFKSDPVNRGWFQGTWADDFGDDVDPSQRPPRTFIGFDFGREHVVAL